MRHLLTGLGSLCVGISTFQYIGWWDVLLVIGIDLIAFGAIEAVKVDRRPLEKDEVA